jgi:hypothetical protein
MAIVTPDPGGAGTDIITVRLGLLDVIDERRNKIFSLSDDVTDTTLAAFLTHMEAVYNAAAVTASYSLIKAITGMRTVPVNALQNSLAESLYLTFDQTSPINPAKRLIRQFVIPAFKDSVLRTGANSVDFAQSDLAAMITFLESKLATKLASTGDLVIGGWSINEGESGFGASFSKYDGQPG